MTKDEQIQRLRESLGDMTEYASELASMYAWKRGTTAKNKAEMERMDADIQKAMALIVLLALASVPAPESKQEAAHG